MKIKRENIQSWQGKNLGAHVLFSSAGIAQHIWVYNERGSILVDTGDGLLRDILSHGLDVDRIKGLTYTHGHFDHMGGLHSLLGFLRMIGRKEPLPVCAPQGCTEVFSTVDNFIKCYRDSIPFKILYEEVQPRRTMHLAEMMIDAYPVVHCGSTDQSGILDQIPAMGYRIFYRGETIAISGDTGACPALQKLVKGADLAILEATYRQSDSVGEESLKKVHLSEDLAIEIGRTAKSYILVHKGERKRITP